MAFSLAAVAFFGAAAVDLALASTLMLAARGRVANRAFAFFLVLVAMVLASLGAGFVVDDAAARDYWARLLWYFGLADDLALFAFVAVYPTRSRWLPRPPWGLVLLLAGLLVLEGLYLADHGLAGAGVAVGGDGSRPLARVDVLLSNLAYGVVPFFLVRSALRDEARRAPTLLVATGLGLSWLFLVAATVARPDSTLPAPDAALFYRAVHTLAAAAQLATIAVLARHALRAGSADSGLVTRLLVLMLSAVAAGLLVTFAVGGLAAGPGQGLALWGVWTAVGHALIAYALLRHQFLGLDLKIKWTLKQSTVAAAFVAVFFIASESAARFFESSVGPYVGIAAAGALVFAIHPLQNLAQRVADRAMPGVKAPEEMTADDRAALYRDLARSAWADGALSRDERAMLDAAQARLGLAGDEAMRIEQEAARGVA